jgi:hypothetical protein
LGEIISGRERERESALKDSAGGIHIEGHFICGHVIKMNS